MSLTVFYKRQCDCTVNVFILLAGCILLVKGNKKMLKQQYKQPEICKDSYSNLRGRWFLSMSFIRISISTRLIMWITLVIAIVVMVIPKPEPLGRAFEDLVKPTHSLPNNSYLLIVQCSLNFCRISDSANKNYFNSNSKHQKDTFKNSLFETTNK